MTLNSQFDLVIVGGGMVGLSLAAALADSSLDIAVIEAYQPEPLSAQPEARVSALNLASQQFLSNLGVWEHIVSQRVGPYTSMQVRDKDSFGQIHFSAEQFHQPQLGHIVENTVIRNTLWQQVERQGKVQILAPEKIEQLMLGESECFVTLSSGRNISTKWLVAADGANSWLREQANIPLSFWDYEHTALVASIKTEFPHQRCARQMFLPEGPLAFLPLYESDLSSIVWSLPADKAAALSSCQPEEFNKHLAMAFGLQLGLCELQGERKTIPLKMRYARDFVKNRIILLGDAAHTIHPLAGLGVNLGFMDAAALAELFQQPSPELQSIRAFERWRKSEAADMIVAMEGFKRLFSGSHPLKKLLRGAGLSMVDQLTPLKKVFAQQALGLNGDLPKLAKTAFTDN